jgi:uncharacterized membrane protein YfhO
VSAKKSGSIKPVKQTLVSEVKNVPDFFENLGTKANWLTFGLIFLVAFIVFKDFIFHTKIYLFRDIGSDSLNASWPWMAHSADYISQYGVPSWTFNMGMGQNLLSFSAYDPFDYLLYPFGKENMPYLIIYKELAKILLAGFLFFRYLKLLRLSNYVSTVGALMFSFCGYMMVGSGWFLFSFEVFIASLLLLSFELMFQKNQWYWFALPMFLIGISRPFNLWLYAIFLFLYILFRIYQSEEKIEIKKTAFLFAKILGVSIIGLGLSAPLFLEHLQVMIDSPRGSGPDSYSHVLSSAPMFSTPDKTEFGTAMLRFFSSDILGSGINFKGWQNLLEAPMFYCGLPCLLLFTQYFSFLDKKVKRFAFVLLTIWILPIIFPYFRRAFWLFSGDYYRSYSFFVSMIFIFFSVNALDKIIVQQKINLRNLIITLVTLVILLNYPYFEDKKAVDGGIKLFAMAALLFYAAMLYLIGKNKNIVNYKYAFLFFLVIELSYFSWCTVNRRSNVSGKDLTIKTGYNDYTTDAIAYLKQSDKSFYRVDKNYYSSPAIHGSLNDGMAQNYYSTSSYNPFNQLHYINYLKTMGIINKVNELESRWSPGLINRFILESLNDVKYVLSKNGYTQPIWHVTHDSIAKFGDVLVLKNKFVMPFGFGYTKYIKLSDFEKLPPAQKDFVSTIACVINDEDMIKTNGLTAYNLKDTLSQNQFTIDVLKQNIDSLKRNVLTITEFTPVKIKAAINLTSQQIIYTSLPFDKGWSVTDNNVLLEKLILSNGMTGFSLGKGQHGLEFVFTSGNYKRGLLISLFSFCTFIAILFLSKRLKLKNNELKAELNEG